MSREYKLEIWRSVITILKIEEEDYVSWKDVARYKDSEHTDTIIQN